MKNCFASMNQFRKLKFAEMFPEDRVGQIIFVLCTIMDKGENGKITISELASQSENASIRDFQNVKRVRGAWIRGAEYQ